MENEEQYARGLKEPACPIDRIRWNDRDRAIF